MSNTKSTHTARIVWLLSLMLVVVIIASIGYAFYQSLQIYKVIETSTFHNGIYIDDINVSGITKEEAQKKINKMHFGEIGVPSISISYFDMETGQPQIYTLSADNIPVRENVDATIDMAYAIGHEGEPTLRLEEVLALSKEPKRLYSNYEIDYDYVCQQVSEFLSSNSRLAQDASIIDIDDAYLHDGGIKVKDHIVGYECLIEETCDAVVDSLSTTNNGVVEVIYKETIPDVLTQDLLSYTWIYERTILSYKGSEVNRELNIKKCVDNVAATIIEPGQELDLKALLGVINEDNGYFTSPKSQWTDNGLDLFASTLFRCSIGADMNISERYPSQEELSYIKAGQESIISKDNTNLRFINTYSESVLIWCEYNDNDDSLKIEILGKEENNKNISILSGTIEDETSSDNENIRYHTWRVYYDEDNKEISREELYVQEYNKKSN